MLVVRLFGVGYSAWRLYKYNRKGLERQDSCAKHGPEQIRSDEKYLASAPKFESPD